MVIGVKHSKKLSTFVFDHLFNSEISEHHVDINGFDSTASKSHDLIPKGFPFKCLHKLNAPTNQHAKFSIYLEHTVTFKKFYQ